MSKDIEAGCGAISWPSEPYRSPAPAPRAATWAEVGEKKKPAPKKGKIGRVESITLDRSEHPRMIYVAKDNVDRGVEATKVVRLAGSDSVVICERVEVLGESQFLTITEPAAKAYGARFVVHTRSPIICHGVETVDGDHLQLAPLQVEEGCSGPDARTRGI